ncbi:DUF2867 domain-containing protein [Streptomyces sp. NPDC058045]|uniref:DUF2867 domain-containing protein n=1 Tax=Streptomyces sp. NPDC058045 TaxID=3346311 RepID=UPI0036EEA5B3
MRARRRGPTKVRRTGPGRALRVEGHRGEGDADRGGCRRRPAAYVQRHRGAGGGGQGRHASELPLDVRGARGRARPEGVCTTAVRYHRAAGRLYFTAIKPFHLAVMIGLVHRAAAPAARGR